MEIIPDADGRVAFPRRKRSGFDHHRSRTGTHIRFPARRSPGALPCPLLHVPMVTVAIPALASIPLSERRNDAPDEACFQCQDPDEEFRLSFHQHWIRLAWPIAKTFLLTSLVLMIGYMTFFAIDITDATARHLILIFLLAFFVFVQLEFLVRFYQYFLYLIIVTDRRVHRIKKTLFLIDDHECIDLWVLQEIQKVQRGPMQNIFGFGTLKLEAQDTHLILHFIPDIKERYGEIMHLREMARKGPRRVSVATA